MNCYDMAKQMLGVETLPTSLFNALADVDGLSVSVGGGLVSRQAVAILVSMWRRNEANKVPKQSNQTERK